MSRFKTVGVMGGMGPAATADFFAKVIRETEAASDQDHLRLIIDNNPHIPDRNAAVAGGRSPAIALAEMARGLVAAGADFLVMACNAAHAYQREIEAAVAAPFLSMIDETADAAARLTPRPRRIGVLAADGCLEAALYQRALAARDLTPVLLTPVRQRAFMDLLYSIKAGERDGVRAEMAALALALVHDGGEAVIAGCTEVPLVLAPESLPAPLINSTDVLVARTIAFAKGLEGRAGAA